MTRVFFALRGWLLWTFKGELFVSRGRWVKMQQQQYLNKVNRKTGNRTGMDIRVAASGKAPPKRVRFPPVAISVNVIISSLVRAGC